MSKTLIIVILGLILVSSILLVSFLEGTITGDTLKEDISKTTILNDSKESLEDKQEKAIQLQRKLLGRDVNG